MLTGFRKHFKKCLVNTVSYSQENNYTSRYLDSKYFFKNRRSCKCDHNFYCMKESPIVAELKNIATAMLGGQITTFRSGFCLEQTQHFCCQKCHPKPGGKQARANFAKLEQTEILNFFKFPLVLTRHGASCYVCAQFSR